MYSPEERMYALNTYEISYFMDSSILMAASMIEFSKSKYQIQDYWNPHPKTRLLVTNLMISIEVLLLVSA